MGRTPARLAAIAALALLLAIPLAEAHATRVRGSESPLAGSRLTEIPGEVSVVVTEPLDPDGSFLRVTRADGQRVDTGPTRISDATSDSPRMAVSLRPDAGDGAYTVTLQTLSTTDGHPWTESFGFAVGDFDPPATASQGKGVPVDAALGRFLAYAGLALGFGAALWLLWMPGARVTWPERYVHEPLLGAGILHTAGLLLLIHSTASASGLALAAFAASDVGRLLFVRLLLGLGALVLAAFAFHPLTRTRSGPLVAVVLIATAAVMSSRLGHASLAGLPGIASDAIHLAPALAWVGGLAVFLWVLSNAAGRLTVQDVRALGLRFGTAALVCVILLALAGVATTLIIIGPDAVRHPWRTVSSPWGIFLAAKVGLTVAMLAFAAVNRLVFLAPPTDQGVAGIVQRLAGKAWGGLRSLDAVADARGLRRIVAIEAALGLVVLALAGALTAVAPPADASDETGGLHLSGSGRDHHAVAMLSPAPRVGHVSDAHLMVGTHAGGTVTADECGRSGCLSLTVTYADDPALAERHVLTPDGEGGWQADGILWTRAGNATLTLRIQTAEVFEDEVAFSLRVA